MTKYSYQDFIHLHNHTEYSMLDSTARIEDMVAKAKSCGMKALAMTDHGKMYGTLKFYNTCKKNNIKPIIGCEIYTTNHLDSKIKEQFHLVLLAENNTGYHNLCRIVSEATEHVYYKPLVDKNILKEYHDGLICLTACIGGELPQAILSKDEALAKKTLEELIDVFGKDNFYLELQNHGINEEAFVGKKLISYAEEYGLKLVATNDIHYIDKEDWKVQDILLCLQTGKLVSDENRMRFPKHEFYFKTPEEMNNLFHDYQGCLTNTMEIADRCNVEIEFGKRLAPKFPKVPTGYTEESYLRYLCNKSLPINYPAEDLDKAKKRLDYELDVISKMKYPGYFLIVWDFINHAREVGIEIGPGRGSAAGSIVAYLMGITELDPLKYDLLFERFLNPERVSMPDIDTDISDSNTIADYMIHTYQLDKSAKIVSFQTEASRNVVRDIVKVNNLPYAFGALLAKKISPKAKTINKAIEMNEELKNLYDTDDSARMVLDLAKKIQGLPRQIGTHAAGVVISQMPLKDILPVEKLEDGLHTCFDKDEVEKLGLLKMDLLGLKNLYIIQYAKKLIKDKYNKEIDFKKIPLDDEKTMNMLQKGDTFGVFQLESDGMTDLVKKLVPHEFRDLIPLVALYRPGPLGSGMVSDFIECRHGRKEIAYMHPLLEPILKETFGVILYQEQVMKIVQVLAGFSLGKADVMRRAMGHKEPELLQKQKIDFVTGCKEKNNIDEKLAADIFELMMHFASYGFNKSHSAAYAYVAYQTAYLKANYPLEYISAYVSNNLDKENKVYAAINNCKLHGLQLLPPNVCKSDYIFKPETDTAVRFGFGAVKALGLSTVSQLMEERKKSQFVSVEDFLYRVNISQSNFKNLCLLNAFSDLYTNQEELCFLSEKIYDLISTLKKNEKKRKSKECKGTVSLFGEDEFKICLPTIESLKKGINTNFKKMTVSEKLNIEKELLGFYASNQPLDYCKKTLEKCDNIEDILDNPLKYDGKSVNICGFKDSMRTIITKKRQAMAFMSLSVYDKKIDCVIFSKQFDKLSSDGYIDKSIYLLKHAIVQYKDEKVQLIANEIQAKNL